MKETSICCNILWVLAGGWVMAFFWLFLGAMYCISVVGIPFGLQCFKMGSYYCWPFGRITREKENPGLCSMICNVIWFFCGGIELFFLEIIWGLLNCMSICGIPFGIQHFKFAILAICPFGKEIVDEEGEEPLVVVKPVIQPVAVPVAVPVAGVTPVAAQPVTPLQPS